MRCSSSRLECRLSWYCSSERPRVNATSVWVIRLLSGVRSSWAMSAEKFDSRTKASSRRASIALKACTSCCSSAGVESSGMRSRSDLAETEAATWVTSRKGRKPLRTSSQPSSPLSSAHSTSAAQSQPLKVWKKALCAVTSSMTSSVRRRPPTSTCPASPRQTRPSRVSSPSFSPISMSSDGSAACCSGRGKSCVPASSKTKPRISLWPSNSTCSCGRTRSKCSRSSRPVSRRRLASSFSCSVWRSSSSK